MRKSLRPFCLPQFISGVLLLIAGSSAVRATDFHWKDLSVGGLYSDPNNWAPATGTSGDGPPKAGDTAGFPAQIVEFKAGDAADAAGITVGGTVFDLTSGGYNVSGAVTITNNSILTVFAQGTGNTLAAGSIVFNAGDAIEVDAGAKLSTGGISSDFGVARVLTEGGTITVSGKTAAVIEIDGGSFTTGSVLSSGITLTQPMSQFTVAGDLTTSSISVGGEGSVAHAATALTPGQVFVDTGAALSIDGALEIGRSGDGSTLSGLNIKTGGFVASGTAEVPGGNGPTIPVDGVASTWLVNGLLRTGTVANGSVTVNMDHGGQLDAGAMDLSVAANSNTVILVDDTGLLGSALVVTQGPLRVGVGGYASVSVVDGRTTIRGGAPVQLGVDPGGDGRFGVYGSGTKFEGGDAPIQVGVAGHGAMFVGDSAEITTGPVNVAVQPTGGTSDNPSSLNVNGDLSRWTVHGPLAIAKTGGTARVSASGGGTLVAQSLLLGANGSLDVTAGRMLIGSGTVPAAGTLLVAGGGILSGQGRAQGTTVINTSVTGNVVIGAGGTFVPGGDPNVFSILGDCDLSGGETDFEVAGAGTAGTDYGQLIVSGNLTLGGTLRLVLLDGYTPMVGDTLDLVLAGAINGSFAQIIAPGLTLSPVPGTGKLSVQVTGVAAMPAPVVTSATTATGSVGSPFSYQIAATNSPAGYAATGLPDGLMFNAASGLISGTPAAAGTFSVGIAATNPGGTGAATLTLQVVAPLPGVPVVTSAAGATGTLGQAFSYQITATNTPTSFAVGGLPAGLSISASGLISGTPTQAGAFPLTVSASNGVGTGTAALTLTVVPALPEVTLVATTPTVTVGSGEVGKFTLNLSAAQDHDVVVTFAIKGNAANGTDYTLLKTTKKIKAGKTSKPIKIKPLGDLGGANKKTVKLVLQPGTGYTVGTTGKVKLSILAGQ